MRLFELTARSFRNLNPDPFFFGAGITLVTGENAQGKTNLLEAVAALCGQPSFRGARPWEMAAEGEAFALSGVIERGGAVGMAGAGASGDTERLSVSWSRATGRVFTRGEKPISFSEASRLAPAVFFAPEHREILTGGPSVRRRFLDRLVLASRPAGALDLSRYGRALAERNALLAQTGKPGRLGKPGRGSAGDGGDSGEGELSAWTEELVRAGAAVRRHRGEALADFLVFLEPLLDGAGPEYSATSVSYPSERQGEEDLRQEFERLGPVERRRGHSLAGPHRDDLVFSRGGRPLAAQASAGEIHRTVALIKLAEWQTVAKATGVSPLLGVDEFEAGLSPAWSEAFVASLPKGATVLLTSAGDPARWRRRVDAILEVRAGRMWVADRPRAVGEARGT